ncbi:MAG: FHA domain-containing protein [Chloroflexota bacterium]|nr:FHA domain-containing protein [Chloroflexota bacterium]
MTITCPQCQHKNPDDAEFCENCGAQLPLPNALKASVAAPPPLPVGNAPDGLVCPSCKAPYAVGDVFCFNCGNDLSKLPANQSANAGSNQPSPVAKPLSEEAPAPASKDDGMSPDDWDKAFSAPAGSPVVAVAPAPVASPLSVPPTTSPAEDNAFGLPVATTPPVAPPTSAIPTQLQLQVSGPYGEEVVEYKGHELLLGRQDAKTRVFPDLNLDDGAASRRHFSIWKEKSDGFFYVQDLESSNGTSLNGQDLEPGTPTRLNQGDIIKIGTRYNIQVRIS